MKKFLFVGLMMLLALPVTAKELKIGFVNMQILLNQAPQVIVINKKMQDRFSQPKKELDDLAKTIKDEEKEIKRNELMMTESKLQKSKQDLIEKIKKYREKESALAKQLQTVQNEELAGFRKVVRKVLTEMAESEKYDLILNDGVMYAGESLDITSKLLDRLKKQATAN